MGIKLLLVLTLALLPLQERMKSWQMKHKHPDPHYLSTEGDFKTDTEIRTYPFIIEGHQPTVIEIRGKASQRPDASAQVDEIKAQLFEESKKAP